MAFMVAHLNAPRASSCIVDIVLNATPLMEAPRRCRAQDNDEVDGTSNRVYLHLWYVLVCTATMGTTTLHASDGMA
jgi:hypothetical protein